MIELKPCPFCGGEARVSRNFCSSGGKLMWEDFFVIHECKLMGRMETKRYPMEKGAIKAWNRRDGERHAE